MEEYEQIEKLGTGSFGSVFKMRKKGTNEFVAVKKIRVPKLKDENGIPINILREIAVLKMLNDGQHIVRLLDTQTTINKWRETIYYLIFEYMEMNLPTYISNFGIDGDMVKKLMYQLCKGVAFLHSRAVLHRDLKPDSILINSTNMELKIADFGLSRQFVIPTGEHSLDVMTRWYKAPELLLQVKEYTVAADMWSVGCIFAELATTHVLFRGKSIPDQLQRIYGLLGTPTEQLWSGITKHIGAQSELLSAKDLSSYFPSLDANGQELLSEMLQFNPLKRISAKDAMTHSYFHHLDNVDM